MAKKALVVDNDFFFVEFLTELLENKGYEVVKAYDGKEGISRLGEASFDVLFVDLIMPKIDGKELIKFARRNFPDLNLLIIAVSSTLIEQRDEVSGFDADYCVVKGPIAQMKKIFNGLLDNLEIYGLQGPVCDIVAPGNLYPRQATSELLEGMKFQKAIFDSIGIGVLVVGRDARVVSANAMALEFLNKPLEDVLNIRITAVFHREGRARLVQALKEVSKNLDLRKRTLHLICGFEEIRLVVSVLRVGRDLDGWVLAMEDRNP